MGRASGLSVLPQTSRFSPRQATYASPRIPFIIFKEKWKERQNIFPVLFAHVSSAPRTMPGIQRAIFKYLLKTPLLRSRKLRNWKIDRHCHLVVLNGTDTEILFGVNMGQVHLSKPQFLAKCEMDTTLAVRAYWGCED